MIRTSAPATTAPLGSCTVPVIAPVAPPCANIWPNNARTANATKKSLLAALGIPSPKFCRMTWWLRQIHGIPARKPALVSKEMAARLLKKQPACNNRIDNPALVKHLLQPFVEAAIHENCLSGNVRGALGSQP